MEQRRTPQQGFTLIELAIVLVIIGLLAGGVLVGRDLIRAAELRGVLSDLDKFRSAIQLFRSNYNALPGDLNIASQFWGLSTSCTGTDTEGVCNGNKDGVVSDTTEGWQAWRHLSKAQLIEGVYTGIAPTSFGFIGDTAPPSRISGAGYQFINASKLSNAWTNTTGQPSTENTIRFGGELGPTYRIGDPILTIGEIFSMEEKLDDALPAKGKIWLNYGSSSVCVTSSDMQVSQYNLTDLSRRCTPHFEVY